MSSREVAVSLTVLALIILTVANVSNGQNAACIASGIGQIPDCVLLQQVSCVSWHINCSYSRYLDDHQAYKLLRNQLQVQIRCLLVLEAVYSLHIIIYIDHKILLYMQNVSAREIFCYHPCYQQLVTIYDDCGFTGAANAPEAGKNYAMNFLTFCFVHCFTCGSCRASYF